MASVGENLFDKLSFCPLFSDPQIMFNPVALGVILHVKHRYAIRFVTIL